LDVGRKHEALRQPVLTAAWIVFHEAFTDERVKKAVCRALCQTGTLGEVAKGDIARRSREQSEKLSSTRD
jgi:hypothetical protein